MLGAAPGLILSLPEGLFSIEPREVELPTCDCAAEAAADAGVDGCPAAVEGGARGTVLVAVRLPGGEETPITEAPAAEDAAGPLYEALEFGSQVAASVGPYLFVRTDARTTACGAAHDGWSAAFSVFDLGAGEATELLTAEERARVLAREQTAAFKLFAGDPLVDAARPEDLELTMITPFAISGAGLGLRYQFSARSSFAASDGSWGAYTRSVEVPAAEIPSAIAPYAAIPPALMRFPIPVEGIAVGGFTPVFPTEEQLAEIARRFSAEP